ncbi:MAG: thioredoxin family protein, partial [Gammaproteobacteria bacterium]
MKEIKVLGSGCTKCIKTAELIQVVANECGVQVKIVKESSPQAMLEYGVMKTPAVVVDNRLMHSGTVPDRKQV